MDELLELFDDEQLYQDDSNNNGTNITGNDDSDSENEEKVVVSPEVTRRNRNVEVSISVDDRIGIRMKNRLICGTDLLRMICEYQYYSPAQLSSMSLQCLNTSILADPAIIVDPATVTGRTNMLTVGLVFSNSGSRISSSGNAFAVLQIGSNILTGPTVSVMLFGNAFSTHCRSIKTGHVVAIINPRLLPKKQQNDTTKTYNSRGKDIDYTSISFTVNESQYVKVVAEARDLALCKGTVSSKDVSTGQWVSNSKRCCQYVDTRYNEYCPKHCNQIHKQMNGTTTQSVSSSSSLTAAATNNMQKLRSDVQEYRTLTRINPGRLQHNMVPSNGSMTNNVLRQNTNIINRGNTILNPIATQQHNGLAVKQSTMTTLNPYSSKNKILHHNNNDNNTIINRGNAILNPTSSQSVPKNNNNTMTINTDAKQNNILRPNNTVCNQGNTILNPITSHQQSVDHSTRTNDGSFLDCRTKRLPPIRANPFPIPSNTNNKTNLTTTTARTRNNKRCINTDTVGFNGTVPVPKASRIFGMSTSQQNQSFNLTARPSNAHILKLTDVSNKRAIEARDKQRLIADQIRLGTKQDSTTSTDRSVLMKTSNNKSGTNCTDRVIRKEDLLFAALGDIDLDKVANTKSRYHNQVNAEEHAKSRRIMLTLEAEEDKKLFNDEKKKKKKNSNENEPIQKQYTCKTCKQTFQYYPKGCERLQHNIIVTRTIKEIKTIGETRQAITDAKVEDGGITIAAGLDWSKWK